MSALVLCSLTVVVTLIVSGVAKAKDRGATAAAIVNLRLEQWLPLKPVSRILPWGELALAAWILLVPGWPAVLGGVAAVILFGAYWAVIFRAVYTGNTASCNCFGGRSKAPISAFTLGRNTALLGAALGALLAAINTQASALGMLWGQDAADWLWLLGAAFIAIALWCVYRSELVVVEPVESEDDETPGVFDSTGDEGEEYVRLPIPFGTVKIHATGQQKSLRELAQQQARVLLWVSPSCGSCHRVIEKIDFWQEKLPMLKINPVVSSSGQVKSLGVSPGIEVLVDDGNKTEPVFGRGTPLVVALGADGLMAGGPVLGGGSVVEFMAELMEQFEVV